MDSAQEIDKLPDCLIPRTGSGTNYFISAVIRHFERLGVFVLNNSESIKNAMDKMASIQMLAAENIPVPKTLLAKTPLDLDFVVKEFSFPVILKKVSGSEGKGIVMCKDHSQLEDTMDLLDPNLNMIIQECINSSLGRDIRVFVIGGRAIGAMLRTAKEGKFKANYSAGGSVELLDLTPEVEWLAVESSRIIGLDIAGVDLLIDEEGYQICEINSSPYFKGFEEATNIDVAQEILSFVKVRCGEPL
ncbi:RimK family alpha-L-glutamate ligase [Candidatus Peregrinibacteria bacterium]|jgi:gamma-F420-2:alpha-L-glutamate ligase|nr:RimK family alpha-L-glutamate ligase [Candidatus Peregrinibacteria bacterium]MBT5468487.1 RimK family alpha-L-glutamate ligase [Candidatus Peregrinibacteria bacterium]MBT7338053.1 RimK family alpha-L-glutamate ligase [Candidatus Peregrinibacteria bacterium]